MSLYFVVIRSQQAEPYYMYLDLVQHTEITYFWINKM